MSKATQHLLLIKREFLSSVLDWWYIPGYDGLEVDDSVFGALGCSSCLSRAW